MRMMKYLVVAGFGEERMYLFPQEDTHKGIAEKVADGEHWRAVRGGTVVMEKRLICSGLGAFSLGLPGDREKDTALLLSLLGQGPE